MEREKEQIQLCGYGCGNKAKYPPRKGQRKYCCVKEWRYCPNVVKNKSKKMKIKWKESNSILRSENVNNLRKIGVKKSWENDLERRKKLSEWNIKKWKDINSFFHDINVRKKIGNTTNKYFNDPNSKFNDPELRKKWAVKIKLSIKEISKKYPLFYQIEIMRYNPDKPGENEIQVHCKNHKCENSKEKGGWFTPTKSQISERIRQIENINGNNGSYFYCSDECKNDCSLFNKSVSQLIKEDQIKAGIIKEEYYNLEEYNIWRQEVLERAENICEYCGEKAEHCHHIKPQKLEPFFSLDPDYGIACCKECHYKYGHQNECSTGQLASKVCI